MTSDDQLAIAADLVRREAGRPRQASLKRAVSTAYYAVFHALAHECVAQTLGWRFRSGDYWDVVTPIYRAVDHGAARAHFRRLSADPSTPIELRIVAEIFLELQADRIRADYDPRPAFNRSDATRSVALAKRAVTALRALPDAAKRSLVVNLIFKQR